MANGYGTTATEMKGELHADFKHDLRNLILHGIASHGIRSKYVVKMEIRHFLAKWFEILERQSIQCRAPFSLNVQRNNNLVERTWQIRDEARGKRNGPRTSQKA